MQGISIVAASDDRLAALRAMLPGELSAECLRPQDLPPQGPHGIAILDIDLGSADEVQAVKSWLSRPPGQEKVIVCVDETGSHLQITQARALGATAVVFRPLQTALLRRILLGHRECAEATPRSIGDPTPDLNAVADLFMAAQSGQGPSAEAAAQAGSAIVKRLQAIGLADYLAAIRSHHSRTYRHCLTTTAVAVSFGVHLGFGRTDTERLAVAGLLHDIGKAKISLDLLEKPTALSEEETAIMREHPMLGHGMLRGIPGLPDDTVDMVLHHHEYLDGSGYPHGLQGSRISDLNRMMTIADVYGAMIEPRSYKPSMTGRQALNALYEMGPKLDSALVRVFAPLACSLDGLDAMSANASLVLQSGTN